LELATRLSASRLVGFPCGVPASLQLPSVRRFSPWAVSSAIPSFRGENDLLEEVIVLPKGANLRDRFGTSVTPIGGKFSKTYTNSGNRAVVIGTHDEKLTFGKSDSIS